jgi:plasmid maintenance system antidote protein VapI
MPFELDATLDTEMAEFLRLTKMSAAEAARKLGVHRNTLSNYLHQKQKLDRKTRLAMAAILQGVSEFRGSSA